MHSPEEVVLAVVEDIVSQGHAGGDKLGDVALDQAVLHQLGVFELLADGHTFAGPDEFWQVGVEGVVGKPGKLD